MNLLTEITMTASGLGTKSINFLKSNKVSKSPTVELDIKDEFYHFQGRLRTDKIFTVILSLATYSLVLVLVGLIGSIFYLGWEYLTPNLFENFSSRFPSKAGLKGGLYGTMMLVGLTIAIVVPLSISTAIYIEEILKPGRIRKFLLLNLNNLSGVPSIVFGIVGLSIFVQYLGFGRSVLSGALTLSLLALPIITVSAIEAFRVVPKSIRDAAYSLGANKLQVVFYHVLPNSIPTIMTGTILAISRIVGETAPLIVVGAVAYVAFTPEGVFDDYSALPIQIFNWLSRPNVEFHHLAAAGIIVLLAILLTFNSVAVCIRNKYQKKLG